MNLLFYLPRDLQCLLAKYLLPQTPVPVFAGITSSPWKEVNLDSVELYQELVQQPFPRLLEWDLGKSLLKRKLKYREIQTLYSGSRASCLAYNFRLLWILGLAEKYQAWLLLLTPEERTQVDTLILRDINRTYISRKMLIYILKSGQFPPTEEMAISLKSFSLFRLFLEQGGVLTISGLVKSLSLPKFTPIYRAQWTQFSLAEFNEILRHSLFAGKDIDLLYFYQRINLTLPLDKPDEEIITTIGWLVQFQLPHYLPCLPLTPLLVARTRSWLPEERWTDVFLDQIDFLLQRNSSFVLGYIMFYHLLLTTPNFDSSPRFSAQWERVMNLPWAAEIRDRISPLISDKELKNFN